VNCLKIIGIAVPAFILPVLLKGRGVPKSLAPLIKIGGLFFISSLIASVGMLVLHEKTMWAVDYFTRSLNLFIGLFLFSFIAKDRYSFKKLIIILLLAGLFPMLMGLYQAMTGQIWQLRTTTGGLIRNVGLYHDAFSLRALGFQTLAAIIFAVSYFPPKKVGWKVLLVIYAMICSLVIFKVYSKAAVVIGISWIFIWTIGHKNKYGTFFAILLILAVFFIRGDLLVKDIMEMFSKEISVYQGVMEQRYILSGRTVIWEDYWKQWQGFSLATQFIGAWKNVPAHNDFLRIIYCNGVLGLLVYLTFLLKTAVVLFKRNAAQRSSLTIMALVLFGTWMIDTIGLTPTMYPGYSWFIWGFIGLAIRGVPGLEESRPVLAKATFGRKSLMIKEPNKIYSIKN